MDAAKRGQAALDAGNCADAVKEYTAAIKEMPKAVDYYLKRSSAHQRSSPPNYTAALTDAETGLHYAFERARRELIGQAQLRRATILFNMGQYANAQFVLDFVKKVDEKNKTIPIWEAKIASKLKALPEDAEARKVTTVERPKVDLSGDKERTKTAAAEPGSATTGTPNAPTKPAQTPPSQIKHDWYQTKDTVVFSLLAKGVPQDKAQIEIEEHLVCHSHASPSFVWTSEHRG
jgi:suppressor of G2 allele of SKP1